MDQAFPERVAELQRRMADAGMDVAPFTDPDSV